MPQNLIVSLIAIASVVLMGIVGYLIDKSAEPDQRASMKETEHRR